jgi:ABC-type branched-subunit amino acid transport system ATPase component
MDRSIEGAAAPIVSARGLTMEFGRLRALAGVDIDIAQGTCTGLIGPNGSGKSTLVNCLSGLLRPTGGSVRFAGQEVTRWSVRRRARAGLARNFQNLRLFEDLSVRENIVVAGALSRVRGRFGEAALRRTAGRFGLEDHLDARVGDLSWGHRRRVELARVLHGRPRFLLLDEPGAGLDVAERRRLPEVIDQMSDNGVGTLLIDHDITLIGAVCRRVLVLREGRLIFDGTPDDAFNDADVRDCYLGERHGAA